MTKYFGIFHDLNSYLQSFNQFLTDNYKIEELDVLRVEQDDYFLSISGKGWNDFSFPRRPELPGVYFFYGHCETAPEQYGLYIGKASLSSTTGKRLWGHFRHAFSEDKIVYKTARSGERYIIEGITAIPFEKPEMICLTSALEEFLIRKFDEADRYTLLNVRGNR